MIKTVAHVQYQPRGAWSAVCLPITEAQGRALYPLKGVQCFNTYADAEFWLMLERKPGDALVLASIVEMGGFALIGHAQL